MHDHDDDGDDTAADMIMITVMCNGSAGDEGDHDGWLDVAIFS